VKPTWVLYDRDCGFCRSTLALLLAWDRAGRLRPLALQDEQAAELLGGMSEAERLESVRVIAPGGEPVAGGRAFAQVLRALPGGAPVARLAELRPEATQRGYEWVAGHRTLLSRFVPAAAKRRADALVARRAGRA
jgi:predicted DCC family thiol-disulfide oxidoreductase YuxK